MSATSSKLAPAPSSSVARVCLVRVRIGHTRFLEHRLQSALDYADRRARRAGAVDEVIVGAVRIRTPRPWEFLEGCLQFDGIGSRTVSPVFGCEAVFLPSVRAIARARRQKQRRPRP